MNNLRQIANDVEKSFSEPKCLEHRIQYVSIKEIADICISRLFKK